MFFTPADYLAADPERAQSGREAWRLRNDAAQRARLCEAATQVIAEFGFEAASAKKTFRAADLGPATFYRLYRDFEGCALEAFERCAQTGLDRVREAARLGGSDPRERARAALDEAVEVLERHPAVARLLLVEIRVGGRACREAHQRWLDRLAALLVGEERPGALARLSARALAELVAARVMAGEPSEEPAGVEELLTVALWPRLGAASEDAEAWSSPGEVGAPAPTEAERAGRAEQRAGERRAQRRRILEAMREAVGEKGYRGARIEDVARAAGFSAPLFYIHFASKEQCLLEVFDTELAQLLRRIQAALVGAESCSERVPRGLEALLDSMASDVAVARILAREVKACGPRGQERYEDALEEVARAIEGPGDRGSCAAESAPRIGNRQCSPPYHLPQPRCDRSRPGRPAAPGRSFASPARSRSRSA